MKNNDAPLACRKREQRAGVRFAGQSQHIQHGEKRSRTFFRIHKPSVLIDKVQYAPRRFTYIRIHIDEHHNPGDFLDDRFADFPPLCGVQEFLAGLVAPLYMSPLSQREIIGADCVPFTTNTETLIDE